MTDWYDEDDPAIGTGGTADSPASSGVHCDACNSWMDDGDTHCPNCGSARWRLADEKSQRRRSSGPTVTGHGPRRG